MRRAIYQTIIDDLLEAMKAGTLQPGDRVWTIREIEERYQVSQITALRVFKELAAEGKIVRRDGTGYFVASPAPTAHGNAIAVAFRPLREYNDKDNYGNRIFSGIMRGAIHNGMELRIPPAVSFLRSRIPSEAETRRLAEELSSMGHLAGVLFDFRFSDEMLRDILLPACRGSVAVVVGRKSALPGVISSAVPMTPCGKELAQFALRCGGKRFVLFPIPLIADGEELINAFHTELSASGVAPKNVEINRDGNLSPQQNEEVFDRLAVQIRNNGGYTVLFTSSDSWGYELCTALTLRGLRPRKEFGVLSFGGYEIAFTHSPKLACAAVDVEKIGMSAAEAVVSDSAASKGIYFTDYKIVLNESL